MIDGHTGILLKLILVILSLDVKWGTLKFNRYIYLFLFVGEEKEIFRRTSGDAGINRNN